MKDSQILWNITLYLHEQKQSIEKAHSEMLSGPELHKREGAIITLDAILKKIAQLKESE